MKIAVVGLWHLGSVTAACLASVVHELIGYDSDLSVIDQLNRAEAPLFEPGLNELLQSGISSKHLKFTTNKQDLGEAEIIWVTYDTPVNAEDEADVNYVYNQITALFPYLAKGSLILVSSQLPVGSVAYLEKLYLETCPEKQLSFACSPENLRLGKAIEIFTKPDRVVVGVRNEQDKNKIAKMLEKFTQAICWMSVESAEMTKHALNAFLATSVVFINELAALCEQVGADAREVERGLKSEIRIGPKAYLKPGAAFAGGTLARDVSYLIQAGEKHLIQTKLFDAVLESNRLHRQWAERRVKDILGDLNNKRVSILGLTYKPGTDTLRCSTAVELCQQLAEQGAHIVAYDPAVRALPIHLEKTINLKSSIAEALADAEALVICTEWPEFLSLTLKDMQQLKRALVFDASGFLESTLGRDASVDYFTVGR